MPRRTALAAGVAVDLIDRHPVLDDESDLMSKQPALTSSSFDAEDLIDAGTDQNQGGNQLASH